MALVSQDEVERKYVVAAATVLPNLALVQGVDSVGDPVVHDLDAVYFDTADLDLTRSGMTLRRRTGGEDAGWHLKQPKGADTRRETRLPLGPAVHTVPAALRARVSGATQGRPLVPVARVSTRRRVYSLDGPGAVPLAVLCDDEVEAERLIGSPRVQSCREWEVELTGGSRDVLDAVEGVLVGAGATSPPQSSKLERALADVDGEPKRSPSM